MWVVVWVIIGRLYIEEVVQDVWFVVVCGLDGFQGCLSLKIWLLIIIVNIVKSCLCQVCWEVFFDDLLGFYGMVDDQCFVVDGYWSQLLYVWYEDLLEVLFVEGELCDCLDKIFNGLFELQCSVLILCECQGLELEEICDFLDIMFFNVWVLLYCVCLKVFVILEYFEEIG